MYAEGHTNLWGNALIFSPYMRRSFAPDPSEFPNIWGKFYFIFISVSLLWLYMFLWVMCKCAVSCAAGQGSSPHLSTRGSTEEHSSERWKNILSPLYKLSKAEESQARGERSRLRKKGGFFWIFSFYVRYSTLLHLPPLRLHCVGRCWDRTQDSCNYGIGCQTLG